jgi:hypothetical protein
MEQINNNNSNSNNNNINFIKPNQSYNWEARKVKKRIYIYLH